MTPPIVPALYAVLFSAGGRSWLEKGLGVEYVAKVAAVYEGLEYQTRLLIGPAMNAFGRETWYDLGVGRPLSEVLIGRDNPANLRIAEAACTYLSEATEILSNEARHAARSSAEIVMELLPRFRFRLQHPNVDIEVAFAAAAALMPGVQLGASGAAAVPGLPPPPVPSMTSLNSSGSPNNNSHGNNHGGIGHGGGTFASPNRASAGHRTTTTNNNGHATTPNGKPMSEIQCRVCKNYGHMKVDCPQSPLNKARVSNNAGGGGNPPRIANRTRAAPVMPAPASSSSANPRDAAPGPGKPCWRCGKMGHTKKTCPEMTEKKRIRKEQDDGDDGDDADDDDNGRHALSVSPSQPGGGGDNGDDAEGWA